MVSTVAVLLVLWVSLINNTYIIYTYNIMLYTAVCYIQLTVITMSAQAETNTNAFIFA